MVTHTQNATITYIIIRGNKKWVFFFFLLFLKGHITHFISCIHNLICKAQQKWTWFLFDFTFTPNNHNVLHESMHRSLVVPRGICLALRKSAINLYLLLTFLLYCMICPCSLWCLCPSQNTSTWTTSVSRPPGYFSSLCTGHAPYLPFKP